MVVAIANAANLGGASRNLTAYRSWFACGRAPWLSRGRFDNERSCAPIVFSGMLGNDNAAHNIFAVVEQALYARSHFLTLDQMGWLLGHPLPAIVVG